MKSSESTKVQMSAIIVLAALVCLTSIGVFGFYRSYAQVQGPFQDQKCRALLDPGCDIRSREIYAPAAMT